MRQAGAARAGTAGSLRFRQAAAAAGVLFSRAYARAEAIHRAMLARGFDGRIPVFTRRGFQTADSAFVLIAALLAITIRTAVRS